MKYAKMQQKPAKLATASNQAAYFGDMPDVIATVAATLERFGVDEEERESYMAELYQ